MTTVLLGFEKKKQLLWQIKTSFLNFRPKLDDCMFKYSLDTASTSMYIINLLCYVTGVRTAAFATFYAQISFLGSFMFLFFVVPKTY